MRTRSKLALVAGALTLLGVGALGWSRVASRADARAGASDQHAAEGSATRDAPCGDATDCGRLLKTVEADIAFRTARAAGRDDAWLEWKTIALDHLERAHLTGDPSAYAAAQRALDTAFEQSPPGSGPFLARARMNFTLHRFDAVEPDLVRAERAVLVHAKTRARIALFRADVLYNLQRYDEADAAYRELLKGPPTIGLLASAAQAARRTGDFRRGEALLEQAGARRILLVTSAFHMRRAARLFAAQGLEVIPAPTDYQRLVAPETAVLPAWAPEVGNLTRSTRALHELWGYWVYRLRGWL